MQNTLIAFAACFVVLHDPAGNELWIQADHITTMQRSAPHHDHVVSTSGAIITIDSKNKAVMEQPAEIAKMRDNCASK